MKLEFFDDKIIFSVVFSQNLNKKNNAYQIKKRVKAVVYYYY